jgi:hypothetical protein
MVDKISPEKDIAKLNANIPRSLASAIPEPILYEHGQVGLCHDLIFGISLVDYATAKGLQEGEVPKIIRICIKEIDRRGLGSEGIYRVCYFFLRLAALTALPEKGFWPSCRCASCR